MDRQPTWPQLKSSRASQRKTPTHSTPGGSQSGPPLMMSASSSGSFHSSLYLLAVSMTLAAVYLWGAKGNSGQGREVGPTEGKLLPTS